MIYRRMGRVKTNTFYVLFRASSGLYGQYAKVEGFSVSDAESTAMKHWGGYAVAKVVTKQTFEETYGVYGFKYCGIHLGINKEEETK